LVAQYSITFPSVFPPIARSLNVFVVLVLSLLISVSAFGYQDLGPRRNLFKMDGVEVEGLKKVERQAILEKVGSRAGMMLDNYLLRKDIEKIYSLKYFESVEAHKKKKNGKTFLTFVVKEKPIITKIIFQGNDEIDEDDLKATIKTKAFAILDVNTIQNDLEALQKQY
jgi:outer membrane protein insertion porin family